MKLLVSDGSLSGDGVRCLWRVCSKLKSIKPISNQNAERLGFCQKKADYQEF